MGRNKKSKNAVLILPMISLLLLLANVNINKLTLIGLCLCAHICMYHHLNKEIWCRFELMRNKNASGLIDLNMSLWCSRYCIMDTIKNKIIYK